MKRFTVRRAQELRADRRARDKHFAEWHKLKAERDRYRHALEVLRASTAANQATVQLVVRQASEASNG